MPFVYVRMVSSIQGLGFDSHSQKQNLEMTNIVFTFTFLRKGLFFIFFNILYFVHTLCELRTSFVVKNLKRYRQNYLRLKIYTKKISVLLNW